MTTGTADATKVLTQALADGVTTADVALTTTNEVSNRWEAAGVTWTTSQTIGTVKFINGSWDGNGSFASSLALQTTTNGTTWVTSTWTVSPTYSYTNTTAGITYTFTGAPVLVRGVRVVGLVNTSASSSKRARVREVLAYAGQNVVGSLLNPTMAVAEERAPSGENATASGVSKVLARPEQQGAGTVCAAFGIAVSGCEARSYYSFGGQRVAMRVQRDEQPSGAVTWLLAVPYLVNRAGFEPEPHCLTTSLS